MLRNKYTRSTSSLWNTHSCSGTLPLFFNARNSAESHRLYTSPAARKTPPVTRHSLASRRNFIANNNSESKSDLTWWHFSLGVVIFYSLYNTFNKDNTSQPTKEQVEEERMIEFIIKI